MVINFIMIMLASTPGSYGKKKLWVVGNRFISVKEPVYYKNKNLNIAVETQRFLMEFSSFESLINCLCVALASSMFGN